MPLALGFARQAQVAPTLWVVWHEAAFIGAASEDGLVIEGSLLIGAVPGIVEDGAVDDVGACELMLGGLELIGGDGCARTGAAKSNIASGRMIFAFMVVPRS